MRQVWPVGSFKAGMSTDASALYLMSFKPLCLVVLPRVNLHMKLCRLQAEPEPERIVDKCED